MCRPGTESCSASATVPRAAGEDENSPPSPARAALARPIAAILAGAALAVALGGCSDIYFDRRDSIALSGGDAVAANAAEQTIDPWPPGSGNTNLATDGQRMQSAVERYRTNIVTQPVDPMMLQSLNQSPSTAQSANSSSTAPPPSIAPGTTTTTTTVVTAAPTPSQ